MTGARAPDDERLATVREPTLVIPSADSLGEGILWCARRQALWWTDIHGRRLHTWNPRSGALATHAVPERVGSFGFVAGEDRLVVAFERGLALYDPASGSTEWRLRPDGVGDGVRFNDGRTDRDGRFWAGTMVESPASGREAHLYSLGRGTDARRHFGGVRIANGLCSSPDGAWLYFADSPRRTIWRFPRQPGSAELGERQLFATTPEGAYPDGATVDADGYLWSAHWGAGEVVRYAPDGSIERRLRVPVSQPSCVCFAGAGLDLLCVTTARHGLGADGLAREPLAGSVLLYETGVRGLAEPEYQP
ncbi:MAG: SMP-30/gluconolactonase/LRE family protein [Proteobacteria bacterium]|nr:SMP-30/gluconolactonase/LRE family protein [Pseudomonadota bacterium]